jgi:hypothetical protein
MKASEFKKYTDSLSKFATTRETSIGAQTLIGVQAKPDSLKMIAGNSQAGIVVTLPEGSFSTEEKVSFTIPARPLLQAVKVLPAKQQITLSITKDKFFIVADAGGKVEIKKHGELRDAGFPKKPKQFTAKAEIAGALWKQMGKLFKKISAKVEVPSVQVVGETGYATAVAPGNRPLYASVFFPASGPNEYNMAAYRAFWDALVALTGEGELLWGKQGVLAKTADMEIFSAPYLLSGWDEETKTAERPSEADPWPILRMSGETDVSFTMAKKDLQEIVKGQAPFDELNRVTLEVKADYVKVTPFGTDEGQEIPCEAQGSGIRSVNADYLTGLLSNMDTKQVTLGWGSGQPAIALTAEEYGNWTILLAPVAL